MYFKNLTTTSSGATNYLVLCDGKISTTTYLDEWFSLNQGAVKKGQTKTILLFQNNKGEPMKRIDANAGALYCSIMSNIKDVRVCDNKNSKIVFVDFYDDTTEKAVLHSDDVFSLEQGISICITKKLLSEKTFGNGSSVYNKIIRRALKIYNNSLAEKKKTEEEAERIKKKKEKVKAKKEARKQRRLDAQREYEIEIKKEAYVRAMRELNATS